MERHQPPTVRPARTRDAEAITRVHVAAWQHAYAGLMPESYLSGLSPTDPVRLNRHRDRMRDQGERHQTFVAVVPAGSDPGAPEEVIGFVSAGWCRIDQDPARLDPTTGEVYAIYVSPDALGTGAGRALMDAAVSWLRERGLDPVRLWVLTGNARARRFYERYGFRLDGGRSTFTLDQAGDGPVELDELRYSLTVVLDGHRG